MMTILIVIHPPQKEIMSLSTCATILRLQAQETDDKNSSTAGNGVSRGASPDVR